ncbi:MAG TPA: ATP-binding cassette domain-containing protein [Gemmataceae bacterium]|jgi:ABC-2 type transport system ATP-binding protein
MIQVEHLSKDYGPIRAVDDISFQVGRGEIVGFLGPNGAGKSTTLRILTSYLPATRGVARVAGHDVMTESMRVREHIGYLPQSVPIYPEMRVDEYLQFRAKLKGVDRPTRTKRIEYCLDRCRIREVRRRLVGTLSNGYRQRVGLADALLADPPLLILDEPTSGLDPLQIRETLATIRELAGDHTVLLSTHILSEVEAVCQRVIIISRGRIGLDSELARLGDDSAVITLEARGPADQIANVLRQVDGVRKVVHQPTGDGLSSFEVRTAENADVREQIFQRIAQHQGWTLRRLDLRRRKLEDHFVEVVLREDPAAQAARVA